MEATRQAFTPDSITITRREDGKWDAVAVVLDDGSVGQVKFTLTDARFTLEAHWAPSRSYVYGLACESVPPTIVGYEFGMHSFLQPVTQPDGQNIFLMVYVNEDGCDASPTG